MKMKMLAKKSSAKKSSAKKSPIRSSVEKNKIHISDEIKDAEHARCAKWSGEGNMDECKKNDCWFYRNKNKCSAHYFKLAEKLSNGLKKRTTISRRSRKKSSKKSRRGGGRRRSRASKR